MRVNVYAEEMTDRIEIISKEIDGHTFTGLRIYLELPVTVPSFPVIGEDQERTFSKEELAGCAVSQVKGPFMHRPGDDDSAAVTFWGKRDLREVLAKALDMLDAHYTALTAKAR